MINSGWLIGWVGAKEGRAHRFRQGMTHREEPCHPRRRASRAASGVTPTRLYTSTACPLKRVVRPAVVDKLRVAKQRRENGGATCHLPCAATVPSPSQRRKRVARPLAPTRAQVRRLGFRRIRCWRRGTGASTAAPRTMTTVLCRIDTLTCMWRAAADSHGGADRSGRLRQPAGPGRLHGAQRD